MKRFLSIAFCGFCAGILNGLLGAGGGLVLIPLMGKFTEISQEQLFPASIMILFPICIVSLLFTTGWQGFSFMSAAPFLVGSVIGGICAGKWGKKIPNLWLHKGLGILILWGGIRYLW